MEYQSSSISTGNPRDTAKSTGRLREDDKRTPFYGPCSVTVALLPCTETEGFESHMCPPKVMQIVMVPPQTKQVPVWPTGYRIILFEPRPRWFGAKLPILVRNSSPEIVRPTNPHRQFVDLKTNLWVSSHPAEKTPEVESVDPPVVKGKNNRGFDRCLVTRQAACLMGEGVPLTGPK